MKPPAGYHAVEAPAAWAFALPAARAWVEASLREGQMLREAAARHPAGLPLRGRGAVHAVPGDGGGRWVVRGYRRGGAVAGPLLGDRYARGGLPRPLAEARASLEARKRGVPTPVVVAGAVYPAGALFYRADLVTELVEDAPELADLLFGEAAGQEERGRALTSAGRLVARLAAAGVLHPDLNARNVLLSRRGAGPAVVVDLDRCRLGREGAPAAPRRMLARLERSLEKLGRRAGRPLTAEDVDALRSAAGVH